MSIKFCKTCILPSTKPDLEFSKDYICQGCMSYESRKKVDWSKRSQEFKTILNNFKSKNNNYDCVIPVSGGKDSTFQVIKMLERNMNPLCVTAITDKLTDIGRHNLDNIKRLGVDHIEVSTDPTLRRKINKFTLETIGDISWAEHITIFTIPVRIACQLNIPLIIWGENSQNENGGPKKNENAIKLDRKWLEEFGGLLGLRTTDLNAILNIPHNKLIQYTYPSEEEIIKKNITGIFLGYFFPWDGYENYKIAKNRGFKTYDKDLEGSIVNYENLDNAQMRIHDYFKFLKFGYDRVTDWCCWHIRRGRLTRNDAIKINSDKSGKYPNEYMGYSLYEILKEIDCTIDEFNKICDNFTNKKLFKLNNEGELIKSEDGSLIPNFKID
jgi:N-acetyl sugar amidotransferase